MAATKKKSTSGSKKSSGNSRNRSASQAQLWSVVLFALGVLVMLFALIPGGSAWLAIHNLLRGLFGVSVFLVAPIMIYASIMIALDKSQQAVAGKIIQGSILLLLVSGIAQIIFNGEVHGRDFADKLLNLYKSGQELKGGGLFSAVLGWPLLALFQKTGATIVIIILTFVFIMLLTNLTIVDFFRMLGTPFKKMGEAMEQAREEDFELSPGARREEERSVKAQNGKRPRNEPLPANVKRPDNIDIPIPNSKSAKKAAPIEEPEDMPAHPVVAAAAPKEPEKAVPEKKKTAEKKASEKKPSQKQESVIDKFIKKTNGEPAAEKKAEEAPKAAEVTTPVKPEEPKEKVPEKIVIEPDGQIRLKFNDEMDDAYRYPPIDLLNQGKPAASEEAENEQNSNAEILVETLKSFGVQTRIVAIHRGPTVTRYELQPSAGVKISKITGLSDDIALNLAAAGVRIEAPIPGKAAVGIEVPNKHKDSVALRELIESDEFAESKSKISFALGKDIEGNIIIGDIARMPHMIIAGTTGSGKSVCTNSIIMSILYKSSPKDVRLVLIDPKMVEFKTYDGIPHLLIPVVTDPRKAAGALAWAVQEMLKRYKLFADNNVRDIKGYNERAKDTDGMEPLPQIVIAIDELADLMMAASNEVEDSICRLAQMARAAGMHLIIATQRPTVDVITGLIKANIPSRIALTVSSQVDSRTIIDVAGAEKLLGYGDMLYYPQGIPKPVRVQGCFVSTKEVERVVAYIKGDSQAEYDEHIIEEIEKNIPVQKGEKIAADDGGGFSDTDEMVDKAIELVIDMGRASTSSLQSKLKLGYARAARIMDELEQMGVVGPFEGAKPRAVLMSKEQWLEMKMRKEAKSEE